jgi:hypothetical protein
VDFGPNTVPAAVSVSDQHVCVTFEKPHGKVKCWGQHAAFNNIPDTVNTYIGDVPNEVRSSPYLTFDSNATEVYAASGKTCVRFEKSSTWPPMQCVGSGTLPMPAARPAFGLTSAKEPELGCSICSTSCTRHEHMVAPCDGVRDLSCDPCPPTEGNLCDGSETTFPCVTGMQYAGLSHTAWDPENANVFLASGLLHSCMLSAQNVFCWGANVSRTNLLASPLYTRLGLALAHAVSTDSGALGNAWDSLSWLSEATDMARLPMVHLGSQDTFRRIIAGESHTCVVTALHELKCWGSNERGQLGVSSTLTTVVGLLPSTMGDNVRAVTFGTLKSKVLDVSTFAKHSCAILHDSSLWCWGDNSFRQSKPNTTASETTVHWPSRISLAGIVSPEAKPVKVAVNVKNSCVLMSDYSVACWGLATGLGAGVSTGTGPLLAKLTTNDGAGLVHGIYAAGPAAMCAVYDSGHLKCWGDHSLGGGTSLFPAGVSGWITLAAARTQAIYGDSIAETPIASMPKLENFKVKWVKSSYEAVCFGIFDVSRTRHILRCVGHNALGQLGILNDLGVSSPSTALETAAASRDFGSGTLQGDVIAATMNYNSVCALSRSSSGTRALSCLGVIREPTARAGTGVRSSSVFALSFGRNPVADSTGACQACSAPCKADMVQLSGCNATHDRVCIACPPLHSCDGSEFAVDLNSTSTCPVNTYRLFTNGQTTCKTCPIGSVSAAGSKEFTACVCESGKVLSGTALSNMCRACTAGSFCDGGNRETTCEQHSTSPAAATSRLECKCRSGYYEQVLAGVVTCSSCPPNQVCFNDMAITCPPNSAPKASYVNFSAASIRNACPCHAGYGRNPASASDQCSMCEIGFVCDGTHPESLFQACPPSKTTHWTGANATSQCLCENGRMSYNGSNECKLCEIGKYCMNGRAYSCPDIKLTISEGSDDVQFCRCPITKPLDAIDTCLSSWNEVNFPLLTMFVVFCFGVYCM